MAPFVLWPNNLGGISSDGFFGGLPPWVDASKDPGTTSQVDELGFQSSAKKVITMSYFLLSPNLTWLAMVSAVYLIFPYNIAAAAQGWAWSWVLKRFVLNFSMALAYYGFFFAGLYWCQWGKRKFKAGSFPTAANMMHNLYYWSLGVGQWTAWECVVMRLWAAGIVPYSSDSEVLSSWSLLLKNVACVLLVPLWREMHFYSAHRFIHIRAVYRFVHSLHHRNTDPEPFSGMTMHPVEHLYYFSAAFVPTILLSGLSPFVFNWNFFHLAMAPAAGHSGFEDHFHSDQYHYLHHAKFECNYGSPLCGFVDQWCGTFREKLGESKEYRGEATGKKDDCDSASNAHKVWSSQSRLGLPADKYHVMYSVFCVSCFLLVCWGAVANKGVGRLESVMGLPVPMLIASTTAFGPVALAVILCKVSGDRMSWRWPFQRESVLGQFGLFFMCGVLFCLLPVFYVTLWVCAASA